MKDQILNFYKGELMDSEMYRRFALIEKREGLSKVFLKLTEIERLHSKFWKKLGEKKNLDLSKIKISRFKIWKILLLRRLFGLGLAIKVLEGNEDAAVLRYYNFSKQQGLSEEEVNTVRTIVVDELVHEAFFIGSEKDLKISDVRDAIYGTSDGLVEVLAAVSGFAGFIEKSMLIAIAGLIVGIAGTLSMSAGAYLATKSQRELKQTDIRQLMQQVNVAKTDMQQKLKEMFVERGIEKNDAELLAKSLSKDRETLTETLSKEYLGYSEEVLEDPVASAKRVGGAYIIGAIIPIIPYLLSISGIVGVVTSFIMSGIGLTVLGVLVGISSGVSVKKKVLELVLIGISVALATYFIGWAARVIFHISVL